MKNSAQQANVPYLMQIDPPINIEQMFAQLCDYDQVVFGDERTVNNVATTKVI